MLRLEKGKNKEIRVSVRDKRKAFSKTLLYAIAIALGIHLGGFLLIRIQPISSNEQQTLPFTIVETPLASDDGRAEAFVERKNNTHPLEPAQYTPHLPELTYQSALHPLEPLKVKNSVEPFLSMEQDRRDLFFQHTNSEPIIQVRVAGELAERELDYDGVDALKAAVMAETLSSLGVSHTVLFNVQVENRTGMIFWHAVKKLSVSAPFNSFAEKILDVMHFKNSVEGFITTGEIEVAFLWPERNGS